MSKEMLPGFLLTIEDNQSFAQASTELKDVYVIYGLIPAMMKSEDEEGNIDEVYIEPNKPLLITKPDEAIKTLELSNIALTREVKNLISLIPNGSTIALVRIVKRDGEEPNPNSLYEMYEALDFAFENTENFPMKEIIVAGISLDDAVALKAKEPEIMKTVNYSENVDLLPLVGELTNANGGKEFLTPRKFSLSLEMERVNESLEETQDGIYNSFKFKVNDAVAKFIDEEYDGALEDATVVATIQYDGVAGSKTATIQSTNTKLPVTLTKQDASLELKITKPFKLKVDDETVIEIKAVTLDTKILKPVAEENLKVSEVKVTRLSDNADILYRILRHNATITSTQNNCMTFLSPEPPKNNSAKAREEYVNRCLGLYNKVRDRAPTVINGKKMDLGMFLTSPVGVNMIDGIGGITGYPQNRISTIDDKKIITKKPTTSFEKGDVVEVYTHDKLDQITFQAKVESVAVSAVNTTEITLDKSVPSELTSSVTPKYIMNVNNKDFKGTYLARQWSNVCNEVGVKRSPAGITFAGECQLKFSEKELQALDSCKFCTIQQEHGQTVGSVSRSQLMTSTTSQFQKIETLKTIYELVNGSKTIAFKYKGERIDDGTDLALIKTEIEDSVFKPAVGVFITGGYELSLKLKQLKNPNGLKEKALEIDFTVKEIETLSLIRMTARLF